MGLDELLKRSVASSPDNIAVFDAKGNALTYRELDARAEQVAQVLTAAGVRRGDRVGLFLVKTMDCVASIFGILRAEAAYVPVDVDGPTSRAAYIFNDCTVAGVIVGASDRAALRASLAEGHAAWAAPDSASQELRDGLSLERPGEGYVREVGPEDLAYILYTSGSTGVPKGVMHTHRSALSFIDWCSVEFEPKGTDRFTSHAPFHFDLSILDLYVSLKHGAAVVLFTSEEGKQPGLLAQLIEQRQISVWYSTPTILRMLVEYGHLEQVDHSSLRYVFFAGEVFPLKHLHALRAVWPEPTYYNLYGPTETNVCTAHRLEPFVAEAEPQPTPIGKVSSGTTLKVVDLNGAEVSKGLEGELWAQGGSVMAGYWNLPENNARVFVQDAEGLWYRTGDLVRELEDGTLLYIGRRDRMVKRRGYRVELGEIEAALSRHPSISEVGVVAGQGADGDTLIFAHFTWTEDKAPSMIKLNKFCRQHLPLYMLPDRFFAQDVLPKTSSDKLDYKGLEGLSPWTSN